MRAALARARLAPVRQVLTVAQTASAPTLASEARRAVEASAPPRPPSAGPMAVAPAALVGVKTSALQLDTMARLARSGLFGDPTVRSRLKIRPTCKLRPKAVDGQADRRPGVLMYEAKCVLADAGYSGMPQGAATAGIALGTQTGTVAGLVSGASFDCYAIAYNMLGPSCSAGARLQT